MADSRQSWTSGEILHEFLWTIVKHIYETASHSVDAIREAAAGEKPSCLPDRLIDLRRRIVCTTFSFIDGAIGPNYWPGIKLVNAETGKSLSDDLRRDFARVAGESLDVVESSLQKASWTNQEIIQEFLKVITNYTEEELHPEYIDTIREAAADENPNRLKDRLVDLQFGSILTIFSLIDGRSGPTYWPGIKLVNAETGESLSDELDWDFSRVEGEFLDAVELPLGEG